MNVVDKSRTPADVYEELFVPALFQQWGPIVVDAAQIIAGGMGRIGQRVVSLAHAFGMKVVASDVEAPRDVAQSLDLMPTRTCFQWPAARAAKLNGGKEKLKHFLIRAKTLMLLSANSASCSSMIARLLSAK